MFPPAETEPGAAAPAPLTAPAAPDLIAPRPPLSTPPDQDPNHLIQQMIARRGRKKEEGEEKKAEPEGKAAQKEEKKEEKPKLVSDVIAKALKFREKEPKKEEKKEESGAEGGVQTKPDGKTEIKSEEKDDGKGKTIVSKRKPAAQPDPVRMASEAATAAATAVIKAAQPQLKGAPQPVSSPEEALKPADRHEFEVAKYMEQLDPRFKGAPKLILDHVKRSEAYASRWEAANPGRAFDPDDQEHDSFYETLSKPWSDHEFRTAEIEMAAERVAERKAQGSQAKLNELAQENARLELGPVVERTFLAAAGLLAKTIGDEVHDKIVKESFEKLIEEDPVTAEVLSQTIAPLKPLVEAIVQIDDAKGRFPLDEKNPAHQDWLKFLMQKEEQFAGTEDDQGRMFARRTDYAQMAPAQRARHWYLTPDHLVSELVLDAAAVAQERIKSQKETEKKRFEAYAKKMGWTVGAENNGEQKKSEVTKTETRPAHTPSNAEAAKPLSPTVGSGAKIDAKGANAPGAVAGMLAATHSVLFPR